MDQLRQRILRQIDRTRWWLGQAEKAYGKGGFEEGEKNLSLAIAELRLAWEKSWARQPEAEIVGSQRLSAGKFSYAACIALFLVFSMSLAVAIWPLVVNMPGLLPLTDKGIAPPSRDEYYATAEYRGRSATGADHELLRPAETINSPAKAKDGWPRPEIELAGSKKIEIGNYFGQAQWIPLGKGGG